MPNIGEENSLYTNPLEYKGFGTDKKKKPKPASKKPSNKELEKVWGNTSTNLDILGTSKLMESPMPKSKKKSEPTIDWSSVANTTDTGLKTLLSEAGGAEEQFDMAKPIKDAAKEKAKKQAKADQEDFDIRMSDAADRNELAINPRDFENFANDSQKEGGLTELELADKLNSKFSRFGIKVKGSMLGDGLEIGSISNPDLGSYRVRLSEKDSYKQVEELIKNLKDDQFIDKAKAQSPKLVENLVKTAKSFEVPPAKQFELYRQKELEKFEELNSTGLLNWGKGGRVVADDFDSQEQYERFNQWKETGKLPMPTKPEVMKFNADRISKAMDNFSAKKAGGLNENERLTEFALLQDYKKTFENNEPKFIKESEDFNKRSKELNTRIEKYKNNPSKEEYEAIKATTLALTKEHELLSDKFQAYNAEMDNTGKIIAKVVDPSIKNFKANYSRLRQMITGLKSTTTSIASGVVDAIAYIPAAVTDESQDAIMRKDSLGLIQLARELDKEAESYQKTYNVDEIDSWETAGSWLASSITNFVPSVAMAATGPAAIPLFFASAYGEKAEANVINQQDAINRLQANYELLKTESDPSIVAKAQAEIQKDKATLSIPEYKQLTDKVIQGTAEAVFEYAGTLSILKGIGKSLSFMPAKTLKEGMVKAASQTLKNAGKEGLSEFGTTLIGNWSDINIMGENKNLFEGGLESFAQGALMGGGLSAINGSKVIKQGLFSELANKEQKRRSLEIVSKISELTGNSAYVNNQGLPLEKQAPEVQKLVDELLAENEAIKEEVLSRLGSDISIEKAYEIGDINRQARELQQDFKNVSLDPTVELTQLDKAKTVYRDKWNKLMERKQELLSESGTGVQEKEDLYNKSFEFTLTEGFKTYNSRFGIDKAEMVNGLFDGMSEATKLSYIAEAKKEAIDLGQKPLSYGEAYNAAKANFRTKFYTDKITEGRKNAEAYAKANNIGVEFTVAEGKDANAVAIQGIEEALNKNYEASVQALYQKNIESAKLASEIKRLETKKENELKEATALITSGNFEGVNIPIGNNKSAIIVHLPSSIQNGRTGIFAHEVLHAGIRSILKTDSKGNINVAGEKLLSYLEKNDKEAFAKISNRLEAYKDKDGNITDYEEVLNTFSDALAEGTIKAKPMVLDLAKAFLNNALEKTKLNFRFEDNSDVYKTIIEYNRAAHLGKANKSLIQKVFGTGEGISFSKSIDERREELEDKLAQDEIDLDRFEELMEKLDKEEAEAKNPKPKAEVKKEEKPVVDKEEVEAEKIIKDNKGAVASDKVQAIYEAKGVDGAFDIIKLFKPIVSKLVDKRRDAPGFDKPLLTDEIETGKNGLFDLIKSYDPNSGVPLAAYVNKYLPVRAIEASRRILAKEFSKEIDEGSTSYNDSMDDDYSFDSTLDEMREEEERQSGLINPLDMMGDNLSAEYSNTVNAALEAMTEKEIASLTFAKLNDLAPEVTGKFFGIPTAKVTNAAANLATPEIGPIQKIIYDNRVKLIKLLPEGAILEGTPASESLIGTGLSIPRKIQSEFYDQKERLSKGAGLIPFELKKNITHRDFLAAFGIKEDGTGLAFGGKDPRAQTMLAMIRLYGKIASNTAVRMAAVQSLEQQADLKAGASKMQFSKSIQDDAMEYLGIQYSLNSPKEVNKISGQYKVNLNAVLSKYEFEELRLLSNTAIGRSNFNAENLKTHIKFVHNFTRLLPEVLWQDRGLITSLLGLHYRTTGFGFNFKTNDYKKLIDSKGEVITNQEILTEIVNLQQAEAFNETLNKKQKNLSPLAVKLESEIKGLELELVKKSRFHTSINNTKIKNFLKGLKQSKKDTNQIKTYLNNLSKFNEINKKKAELFFEMLRSWVHENGITESEKQQRINSVGLMFLGNANISNGIRSLSSITGVVVDLKSANANYTVEHEEAIIRVVTNIFEKIVNNTANIEFNSTAIIVPEILAKERNKKTDSKTSTKEDYAKMKTQFLKNKKRQFAEVSVNNFSLGTKVDLDWEASMGVTSANFGIGPYTYKIRTASIKDYGLSTDPAYAGAFEKIANNLDIPLEQIINNEKFDWVSFAEESQGDGILDIGNSFKVFGIVTNGLIDHIKKNKLQGIAFDADRFQPSRVRLYNTMATAISSKLGWNYTSFDTNNIEGGVIFAINSSNSGINFSKSFSDDFNAILETTQGISKETQFSDITARMMGANKGKFRLFVPPSAEDFLGLLYDFMGKGKEGEKHMEFFKKTLIHPYVKGVQRIDNIRANIKEGYKALKAEYPAESKKLKSKVEGKEFTYDQAVRVYLWQTNDVTVPGLSSKEVTAMSNAVKKDKRLREFADKLSVASGQLNGWVEPTEYWNVESIVSDLHNATEKVGRRNILKEFIENSEVIFSPENLNKVEAALGSEYRSALEDAMFRMKNGSNKSSGDRFSAAWTNWIANANGTIMFFNTRSALLQTIAATNYLNWSDNNPVAAGRAFLNQPQYWKDFSMIFNSNKLKERREGLKSDVNEAELANAVKDSKNKAKAALSYLLKIGYTPTQIADSFAIAAGGSTFYRNRVITYEKQGMSTKEAEDKAFEDFDNATEESQQSSDPSKLSQQQASTAGRLILAFANTPMQYNRLMKKAFRDLKNKRGDAKTNVSKILYYGAVQNLVFSALQNALFSLIFEDDEEVEDKKNQAKYANILNGMADTILRGTGIAGAVVSTAKNTLMKFLEEREKGFKGDQGKTIVSAFGISPPIGSKASKLYSAIKTDKIDKDVIAKRGFDVLADGKLNLSPSYDVAGKLVAVGTNFPLDRVVDKVNNVAEMLDARNAAWQRVALGLGWKPFDVGAENEEEDLIRSEAKTKRKDDSYEKSYKNRIIKKAELQSKIDNMSDEEYSKYQDSIADVKEKKLERRRRIWEETEKVRDSIKNSKK